LESQWLGVASVRRAAKASSKREACLSAAMVFGLAARWLFSRPVK
jgi:hypothetical protein